jgi:hypothetical protein
MTSKQIAERLYKLTLKRIEDDEDDDHAYLYQSGFFGGQVLKLLGNDAQTMYNQMKDAFLAAPAPENDLSLYLDDISAGIQNGAEFPLTKLKAGNTIKSLNPLVTVWHRIPPWMVARLKVKYRGLAQLDALQSAVQSVSKGSFFGGPFDHWGMTGTTFVSEPYDWSDYKHDIMKRFAESIGASCRLASIPYWHQRTQRVEIFAAGSFTMDLKAT